MKYVEVCRTDVRFDGVLGNLKVYKTLFDYQSHLNSIFQCNTIERYSTLVRDGDYLTRFTYSQKFKKRLPLLHDVVGRSGIRIHSGNSEKDSSGCLCLGTLDFDSFIDPGKHFWVSDSRMACDNFFNLFGIDEKFVVVLISNFNRTAF